MELPVIISVIPPTVLAALATYIFFKGMNDKGIRVFLLLLVVLIGYGILEVIIQSQKDINSVANLLRIKTAFWGLIAPLSNHSVIALMKDKKRKWKLVLAYLYTAGIVLIIFLLSGFTIYKECYIGWWGWSGIMDSSNWVFRVFHIYLVTGLCALLIILFAVRQQTESYRVQKLAQAMLINFIWGGSFVILPYTILSWFKLPTEILLSYAGNVAFFLILFSIEKYQPENFSLKRLIPGLIQLLPASAIMLSPEKQILLPVKRKILFDGFTSDDLRGKGCEEVFADIFLIEREMEKIKINTDYSSSFDTGCYTHDGKTTNMKVSMSGIRNEFNEVIAYLLIFNETSEDESLLKCLQVTYGLTGREKEIAVMLLDGCSNLQICDRLFISLNTIKTHTRNIYQKTNTSNRNEFKNFCMKLAK